METTFYKFQSDLNFNPIQSGRSGYYHDKITTRDFYAGELPLVLSFMEFHETPAIADFHEIGSSFESLNTFVVSPKFKQVLEQMVLPLHRFYPADIYGNGLGITQGYFLFHFLYDFFQEIDYSQSQFAEHWFGAYDEERYIYEQFFNALKKGEIKDKESFDYRLFNETQKKGDSGSIFPLALKLKQYYDVVSMYGSIYFSERAKQMVEDKQLTGTYFKPYNPEAPLHSIEYIPKMTAEMMPIGN